MKTLVLLTAVIFCHFSSAYTFCTNSVPKTGARFIFFGGDRCPPNTERVRGIESRVYFLSKVTSGSCVYRSSFTRQTGDELYCETHLTPQQAVRAIKKSRIKSPILAHLAADLRRKFSTEVSENPTIFGGRPFESYEPHLDTGFSGQSTTDLGAK